MRHTDGYSLDAQKARMKAYADYNDYEIVGTYEDAGKSGKSIEGRIEFNRMMAATADSTEIISFPASLEESIPSSTQIRFTPKSCITCNVESTIRYIAGKSLMDAERQKRFTEHGMSIIL